MGDRRLWSSKTNGKESIEGLVVQILGISVASKIRVFLSPGFRNEGFMIDIRRTDNAFTGLLQSRRAGTGQRAFLLLLFSHIITSQAMF